MSPIKLHYFGGPYDGATEVLDHELLGLREHQSFRLAHVTPQFLHVYACDFWSRLPGETPEVEVRHVEVNPRPDLPVEEPAV